MRKSVACALALLLGLSLRGWAGDQESASISLKLERKEISMPESVRLLVRVSGARQTASEPRIQGLEPFRVTRGGSSSRVEIVNGRVNAGIDYTFVLQPRKTGVFPVGPAEVQLKGRTLRSGTQTLKVTAPPPAAERDRGAVFLTAAIDPLEVYVEEQAVYTLKLYHRTGVRDVSLNLPEAQGLGFTQLGKPLQYQGVHDGKPYQVLEVRYAVVPAAEGLYSLAPARMDLRVPEQNGRSPRGFFDDSFFKDPFFSFSRGRPLSVLSEALSLGVRALPLEGRPVDFSGLVGDFTVTSELSPSRIKAGESATLTVVVKGRGNVNRVPDLEMPELQDLKVYADQPIMEVTQDGEGLGGVKRMKWALVPEREGSCRIPSLSFSYFDTGERQYRRAEAPAHLLEVLPGEAGAAVSASSAERGEEPPRAGKQEVTQIGRDILPVHGSMEAFREGPRMPRRPEVLVLALLLPPLLYVGTLAASRWRRRSMGALPSARARRAARACARRCRQDRLGPEELIHCVRDYFNDRFGLSLGTLTPEEAAGILTSRGAGAHAAGEMAGLLRSLEDAVYAGGQGGAAPQGRDIAGMIRLVERELR